MSGLGKRSLLVLAIFATQIGPACVAQSQRTAREQVDFSAEDEAVHHPIPIPEPIQTLLVKTDFPSVSSFVPSNYSAAQVHLHGRKEIDYVVEAEGELRGANVCVFWVFLPTPDGFKVALDIPAHNLSINRTRHNRYRTITASAETCCVISTVKLHFDGGEYVQVRTSSKEIR